MAEQRGIIMMEVVSMPMTPEERQEALIKMMESWLGGKVNRERVARKQAERLAAERSKNPQEPSSQEPPQKEK